MAQQEENLFSECGVESKSRFPVKRISVTQQILFSMRNLCERAITSAALLIKRRMSYILG